MIRSFFGLDCNPFDESNIALLPHQSEIYDTLKVHSQQGGLCLVLGVPGTGKSVIKEYIKNEAGKEQVVASIARTLHTYTNIIKILCEAFGIDEAGSHFKCERRLIDEAVNLNRLGKSLITIIDDAHLLEMITLRKLRLLFEDFPKNHNLILIGQPPLLDNLSLSINEDIKSRVTYSVIVRRLNEDDIKTFIFSQLDHVVLGHNTFSEAAIDLITRTADGVIRKAKNLCRACLLEAVRKRTKQIDIDIVNEVIIQPHWRKEADFTNF